MRRIGITGLALVIVLTVSTAAASTASASRLILREENGTTLPLGQEIEFYGFGTFAVNSSSLNEECRLPTEYKEMQVYSTLDSNSRSKDKVSLKVGREVEGLVEGTEVTLECAIEGGYAYVGWNPGGETLVLGANGQARLRRMSIRVLFTYGRYEEFECSYSKDALSGTNTATATRQPLMGELSGTLKKVRDSPRACPKTMHVSLSLPKASESYGEGAFIEEEI
jgi:hypothetical protein